MPLLRVIMAAARIAGIAAAKRTVIYSAMPPVSLTAVSVTITPCEPDRVKDSMTTIIAASGTGGMALGLQLSVAALTISYDMCKAVNRAMEISDRAQESAMAGLSLSPKRFLTACQSRDK